MPEWDEEDRFGPRKIRADLSSLQDETVIATFQDGKLVGIDRAVNVIDTPEFRKALKRFEVRSADYWRRLREMTSSG